MSEVLSDLMSDLRQTVIAPNVMTLAAGAGDAATTNAYLAEQRRLVPDVGELTVIDASGTPLATSNEANTTVSEMENQTGELWFDLALEIGVGFDGPFKVPEERAVETLLSLVIPDPSDPTEGDPVGVLKSTMLNRTANMADDFAEQTEGGRLIIFSSTSGLMADSADDDRPFQDTWERDDVEQAVGDAISQARSGEDASGYVIVGDSIAGYYSLNLALVEMGLPSEMFATVAADFSVIVEQPQSVAFASLNSLDTLEDDLESSTNTMIIALAIVVVVVIAGALGVAFYFSRSITKPVEELRDVADMVSMGDMSVTVPKGGDDEIGDLSESFRRMVNAVRFLSQDQDGGAQS
jgi:HAMP domain-containing protein